MVDGRSDRDRTQQNVIVIEESFQIRDEMIAHGHGSGELAHGCADHAPDTPRDRVIAGGKQPAAALHLDLRRLAGTDLAPEHFAKGCPQLLEVQIRTGTLDGPAGLFQLTSQPGERAARIGSDGAIAEGVGPRHPRPRHFNRPRTAMRLMSTATPTSTKFSSGAA